MSDPKIQRSKVTKFLVFDRYPTDNRIRITAIRSGCQEAAIARYARLFPEREPEGIVRAEINESCSTSITKVKRANRFILKGALH